MGVVTLPAYVRLAMRSEIDLGNAPQRPTRVARSAKTPICRLRGTDRSRVRTMLLRRLMTDDTIEGRVMRHRLLRRDLPMAGTAVLWHDRGLRRMGHVTSQARHSRVVGDGVYLRKTRGPGGTVCVAQQAKITIPRDLRLHIHRRSHMGGSRAMADLAGYPFVVPGRSHLRHVTVAHGALLMAGVHHIAGCDRVNRQRPVMTAVPKRLGNQHAPRDQETGYGNEKDHSQTGNLLRHDARCLRLQSSGFRVLWYYMR
jgi:hypothetical protein